MGNMENNLQQEISPAERATELLRGRDSMLVCIDELESLARITTGETGAYLAGVAYARLSLRAAGIERIAA